MLLTKNVLVNAINFVLWSLSDGASFFLYVTKEFLQINNLSCACLGCGYFCFRELGTDVRLGGGVGAGAVGDGPVPLAPGPPCDTSVNSYQHKREQQQRVRNHRRYGLRPCGPSRVAGLRPSGPSWGSSPGPCFGPWLT